MIEVRNYDAKGIDEYSNFDLQIPADQKITRDLEKARSRVAVRFGTIDFQVC